MDVITRPPAPNDADSPLLREVNPSCRHAYVREPSPLGGLTGMLVCIRCRHRTPDKPRERTWTPPVRQSARTGY